MFATIKIHFSGDAENNNIISNKAFFGEKSDKFFVGCIDDAYKIKPFSLKTRGYVKRYNDETKWMYFLIEDEELLKKYHDIWNKVSNSIIKNRIKYSMFL